MRLSNPFKRKAPAEDSGNEMRPSGGGDAVERVRTRTRQRLIGALVLVTIGVIGFPLIFETQPRPIPVDIAIELPRPETAPTLVLPPHRRATGSVPAAADTSPAASAAIAAVAPVVRDVPAEAEAPVTAASTAVSKDTDRTESPAPAPKASAAVSRAEATPPKAAPAEKGAASATVAARFVVQVGAFADPDAAREVRTKMEKLGLKTYTQVADTGAGKRIRVRLGPFSTRAEADKAMARSRDAGVAAVVLTL